MKPPPLNGQQRWATICFQSTHMHYVGNKDCCDDMPPNLVGISVNLPLIHCYITSVAHWGTGAKEIVNPKLFFRPTIWAWIFNILKAVALLINDNWL